MVDRILQHYHRIVGTDLEASPSAALWLFFMAKMMNRQPTFSRWRSGPPPHWAKMDWSLSSPRKIANFENRVACLNRDRAHTVKTIRHTDIHSFRDRRSEQEGHRKGTRSTDHLSRYETRYQGHSGLQERPLHSRRASNRVGKDVLSSEEGHHEPDNV